MTAAGLIRSSAITDLRIEIDLDRFSQTSEVRAWGQTGEADSVPTLLPETFNGELQQLVRLLTTLAPLEGALQVNGSVFRYTRILDVKSPKTRVWHLRQSLQDLLALDGLFPRAVLAEDPDLRKSVSAISNLHQRRAGLVLWVGPGGSGKTTNAAGAHATWLLKTGGVALMLSRPQELSIQREWGENGLFYAEEIPDDDRWAEFVSKAVRPRVNYLLVNEVRTADVAGHVINLAQAGMLVSTTVHGDTAAQGVEKLHSFLEMVMGNSAGLALMQVLHTIIFCDNSNGMPPRLIFYDLTQNSSARSAIHTGEFALLSGYLR